MGFEYDDAGWPIVKTRWSGTVTDRDVDAALVRVDDYLSRERRFGLLIDSRGGGGLSPEQRNRVLSHMKARTQLTSRLLVQAVLIDNLIQRTLYYAVRLLLPSPFPSKVFTHPEPAEAWLRVELGLAERAPPSSKQRPPGEPR
ncbi:MAG TPA: STAS/SEC14 domain-containing protein [Polyangiaceae bacterium]|nr:STAS/SEC14 domain-containing protein [Polyangiaceae bacterium]